eukprot:CAMPEP_0117006794 /NCGR_PEP_ID=MMETSP0472-20121206/6899_1 /TAXON_ID=693140 ORGANISM="Tiarina fusus, Strain LIS" /NCGR_SAMPLE_ID=MMETSP0472 /ASSEMBLY_ACC=CAM_ASM_000603 /LENGTH=180 /DNA_ID=CAMNT_0004708369 /DNA_START=60 /DNA_END=603 /DNA_ORIENTATION=+
MEKEVFMCEFNSILRSYTGRFATFSRTLTNANAVEQMNLPVGNAHEDEESLSYFSSMIKKHFTQICGILQEEEEIMLYLKENFPPEADKKDIVKSTSAKLFDRSRLKKMLVKKANLPSSSVVSSGKEEIVADCYDYFGQITVLKGMLKDETENSRVIEEALRNARERLAILKSQQEDALV